MEPSLKDREFVVGIDVGTQSTRAGVFDLNGRLRGSGSAPISISYPQPDFVEQSSDDIWENTRAAVKDAVKEAGIKKSEILAICFDATCSLVCLDKHGSPLSISPTGDRAKNIIVWMDHRALAETDLINGAPHDVLRYVGGRLSPEQQPPKLLWIKKHLPETWAAAAKFLDLSDFMVLRATGRDARSLCTLVCKWTYLGHRGDGGAWDYGFFEEIGLSDLFRDNRVPAKGYPPGSVAGQLTRESAQDLGLEESIPVGVGIIDAHAGAIGVLGHCASEAAGNVDVWDHALALVGGTSSCHLVTSSMPKFVPGVWGPYYGAMIPSMWLNEGGQSATGSLIDYVIKNNSSFTDIESVARQQKIDVYEFLNREIHKHVLPSVTADIHVLPYHHGNRSPRADAHARGVVFGLTLNQTIEEVAKHYYATIQGIAYGTRHIIEVMNQCGYRISGVYMCGGHLKNDLFLQEHADVTGCNLYLPQEREAVLLGSAILATVAAGRYPSVGEAMKNMSHIGDVIRPNPSARAYHDRKYDIHKKMYGYFKDLKLVMGQK